MRRSFAQAVGLLVCNFLGSVVFAQKVTVGEFIDSGFSTEHPYSQPGTEGVKLILEQEFAYPGATYIALHFAAFDLADGDFVVVRSPDNLQHWVYSGLGRADLGKSEHGFFATHLKGEVAIVEMYATGFGRGYGFDIDFFGRGYNDDEIRAFWDQGLGEVMNLPEPAGSSRSLCTTDDTREAKCYQDSEPEAYEKGRAVVRLLLNGSAWCTGWLVGCDGHVMTNEHCVGNQGQANNIDFEFMAEGPDCATNCGSSLACSGTIEASGGILVAVDAPLDYALMLPDTSVANNTDLPATYGFMQLRESGAALGERLYIPQHPAGWGKRIAMESSYPDDAGGFPTVVSLSETACSGGPGDVGYWADTQGGSSGSPVLGYDDHKVIALHHCRGSAFCASGNSGSDDPNRGVPIEAVIASLGNNLPNCATCDPVDVPQSPGAANNGDNRVDLNWNASAGASSYKIYRTLGTCPQAAYDLIAEGVQGTTYSDTTVSGDVTYAYVIAAFDEVEGCESFKSNCIQVTATGACLLPPVFNGLESAVNSHEQQCAIQLSWSAGSPFCGSSVTYNVYRSDQPGFARGGGTLLASCINGTVYTDMDAESGVTYYYRVHAEDDSGNGTGPCAGGLEEANTVELSAAATGPDNLFFEDDLEQGPANWDALIGPGDPGGTQAWVLVDNAGQSPTHSWFCSDESTVKDQVLQLANPVVPGAGAMLSFFHRFDTENNWDGGVLEVSTDGTNWFDILDGNADRFISNGYVGNLNGSANPLGGRPAWFGDNGAFEEVVVDLGDFAGQTLQLRWRLGCDASASNEGWWIDDIKILIPMPCDFSLPAFSLDMWQNAGLYFGAYDSNSNGGIDVVDILTHWLSNP